MPGTPGILAIDQGTTSSRAIVFDAEGGVVSSAQQEFPQHYPDDGWVEHDPEDIWHTAVNTAQAALSEADGRGYTPVAVGLTNQRETSLLWNRTTGQCLGRAIVWQDRRTAERCAELRADGHEEEVTARTGLLLDPYFSATKLAWLLDRTDGARAAAERGELAFGTVDSYLLWRLTNGRTHATDATNASRTLLFNIHEQRWDPEMLRLFDIPEAILPEVRDCTADFGTAAAEHLGREIPVLGVAGDQQAALVGQACFRPGMIKSTYGTGCFALLNTGAEPVRSRNRLLTTVGYRINGEASYALEGSIFVAGATIQWLRDGLGVLKNAAESERYARGLSSHRGGVYMVPAFTGLGAPYWDAQARGAIFGITRDTGVAELVRAALDSVCYQTHDLVTAMTADSGVQPHELRVDGGMVENAWLLQELSDVLSLTVERPAISETTALGAAYLAGLQAGIYDSLDTIAEHWQSAARYQPRLDESSRQRRLAGWADAVARVRRNVKSSS